MGEILRPVFLADMLEHADGDDEIVWLGHVTVIDEADVGELVEPGAREPRLRVFRLRLGKRDAGDADAGSRRRLGEAAPAAADLEDALAGLHVKLAEDAAVFGLLRVFQAARCVAFEQGAGIGHAVVEPEPVEIVAEVVMGGDVALAGTARVAREGVAQLEPDHAQRLAEEEALDGVEVEQQEGEQRAQVLAVPQPFDIGLGEADLAAHHRFVERVPVVHAHLHGGAGLRAGENAVLALGRGEIQAADGNFLQRGHEDAVRAVAHRGEMLAGGRGHRHALVGSGRVIKNL